MPKEHIISFWSRVLDLISPRQCPVCGDRLGVDERLLCTRCNVRLPRTGFAASPYDNEMARRLWGLMPVERAAALIYYETGAESAHLIWQLKYGGNAEACRQMGFLVGEELLVQGFFDDIDLIVPVPLTPDRERFRGYNQSTELSRGISEATGLSVVSSAVVRTKFSCSQTQKRGRDRLENVRDAFKLADVTAVAHKHVLLVDDVLTTGATLVSCSSEIMKADDGRISVLTLGFTKS